MTAGAGRRVAARRAPLRRVAGYTLVEMVVTIIIVGVMTAAVGVGARTLLDDSKDRSSESNIQRVLLAEQTFARRNGSYTAYVADLGDLREISLTNGASGSPDAVSVALGTRGSLGLAVWRSDTECLIYVAERLDGSGAVHKRILPANTCTGAEALSGTEPQDLSAASTSKSRR